MKYLELVELYEKISSTTKRLEKILFLANFLKKIKDQEKEVLYLLIGEIYPSHLDKKIGISTQIVIKALSKSTSISSEKITQEWKNIGDLGKVAEKIISKKSQLTLSGKKELTIEKILENFRKLPELEGQGTVDKKISLIIELLSSATPKEALYLIRTLLGDLRIGIQESTIRQSLAEAFFKENKKQAEEGIQNALDKTNDLVLIFDIVKKGKLEELSKIKLKVGTPVKVMLAQKIDSIKEGFEKTGKPCAFEYKYDGFRLEIHKNKDQITCYITISRSYSVC